MTLSNMPMKARQGYEIGDVEICPGSPMYPMNRGSTTGVNLNGVTPRWCDTWRKRGNRSLFKQGVGIANELSVNRAALDGILVAARFLRIYESAFDAGSFGAAAGGARSFIRAA